MNELTFEELINLVKNYNPDAAENVTKAYSYASYYHQGQKRESGEDYIIHPLNVAYTLALMHADEATLCAGLLHDVLEDTDATKTDIVSNFGEEVGLLVDGVTKISKLHFYSKEEESFANTRKIITSITEDIRIIIIKLADRLHNMRTLDFKNEFKQKEISLETMEIYVPIAYSIGAYEIKSELEDLAFKHLKPTSYHSILDERNKIKNDNINMMNDMVIKIKRILNDKNIPNDIKIRTKNIYGLYKKLSMGQSINSIDDLLALKIIVDSIDNCYRTLGYVHSIYKPVNEEFKDHICNPKTNMYRSLHTTVFSHSNKLIQTRIRTNEMDKIATYGLSAYWYINKGDARIIMQKELRDKYQFFDSLVKMNSMCNDNKEFVSQVKAELFSDRVYVYTYNGQIIELPKGSTIVDYVFKLDPSLASKMTLPIVNNEYVPFNYVLKTKDRVRIITDEKNHEIRDEWLDYAQTSYAKKLIMELKKK